MERKHLKLTENWFTDEHIFTQLFERKMKINKIAEHALTIIFAVLNRSLIKVSEWFNFNIDYDVSKMK
jgi:hypothetical protein